MIEKECDKTWLDASFALVVADRDPNVLEREGVHLLGQTHVLCHTFAVFAVETRRTVLALGDGFVVRALSADPLVVAREANRRTL